MLGTDTRSQGPTPALFVRTAAFEAIVKEQIRQLEGPGLHCFQPVHGELIPGQLLTKIVRSAEVVMLTLSSDLCGYLASVPSASCAA
jgi:hypothetical protein